MFTYTIRMYTSSLSWAGTNANVYLTLYGDEGESKEQIFKNDLETTFKSGAKDTFTIDTGLSLGTLTKVRVGHDNTGPLPGWKLVKVEVEDDTTGKGVEFDCYNWFDLESGDGRIQRELYPSGEFKAKTYRYRIFFHTGEERFAGTDANVSFTIFGTRGDSGEINLENKGSLTFENGMIDTYDFERRFSLGTLTKVRVGHDNTGLGPGWFLDKITVEDITNGHTVQFPCGRWLASDADDGMIERQLIGDDFERRDEEAKKREKEEQEEEERKRREEEERRMREEEERKRREQEQIERHENERKRKEEERKRRIEENRKKMEAREKRRSREILNDIDEDEERERKRKESEERKRREEELQRKEKIIYQKAEERTLHSQQKESFWNEKSAKKDEKHKKEEEKPKKVEEKPIKEVQKLRDEEEKRWKEMEERWSKEEKRRKEEENRRKEEEKLRKDEEKSRKQEEERRRKEENRRREEENRRGKEEDLREEEANFRKDDPKRRKEEDQRKNEEDQKRKDEDKRRREEEERRKEEDMRRKNEDDRRKEEDDRRRVADIKRHEQLVAAGKLHEKPYRYEVSFHTSDSLFAGTDANIYYTIVGTKGDSGRIKFENRGTTTFEKGMVDTQNVKTQSPLGTLRKICVTRDDEGWFAGWNLSKITIDDKVTGHTVVFPCDRWLKKGELKGDDFEERDKEVRAKEEEQDKERKRQEAERERQENEKKRQQAEKIRQEEEWKRQQAEQKRQEKEEKRQEAERKRQEEEKKREREREKRTYRVYLFTEDAFGAWIGANILFTLYGSDGESGEHIIKSEGPHGMKGKLEIECPHHLGILTHIRIGPDDSGWASPWFLVAVEDPKTDDVVVFTCNRSLDMEKLDSPRIYYPSHTNDVDELLALESDNSEDWTKVKKTKKAQIWRKEAPEKELAPSITKAELQLQGVPYQTAVKYFTDWEIRQQWDKTLGVVDILENIGKFKVIYCSNKMPTFCKTREMVLACLDHPGQQYHVQIMCSILHPSVPQNRKTSKIRAHTSSFGVIIRPVDDGSQSSKVTVITQVDLKGSAPKFIKNGYLEDSPIKRMKMMKRYYKKHRHEEKASTKEQGTEHSSNNNVDDVRA